jgi:hypothetical protein
LSTIGALQVSLTRSLSPFKFLFAFKFLLFLSLGLWCGLLIGQGFIALIYLISFSKIDWVEEEQQQQKIISFSAKDEYFRDRADDDSL